MNQLYHEPKIQSTIGISETFNLTGDDLFHRGKSFVNETTLRLAGIRRISDDIGHQILGKDRPKKDEDYRGLGIPYFNLANLPDKFFVSEWTIRRDMPDQKQNGSGELKEEKKYVKPPGAKNRLYIPPMLSTELLKKDKAVYVFTEGEIKSLALARVATNDFESTEWPFFPIGLSGVDNFRTKQKNKAPNGGKVSVILPDFAYLKLKGSIALICFDSDLSDKPNVKAARFRLTNFLREAGAKVFNIDFPKTFEGAQTKGVDDYLGAIEQKYGKQVAIDTFLEMVDTAQKPKKPTSPVADNFQLIEAGEGVPGVYYTDEKDGSFRVCSPLKIVAETQTHSGENYGRLLEWRDSQNRLHRWAMPIEFAHSTGAELAKFLASNGLDIMPSRKHYEKLAFYITTAKAEKTLISTDRIGLHGECFVLPDTTFGYSENEIVYQTEFDGHHKIKSSGALAEWQNKIARYCQGNSRLLFTVSAAFAAPLLSILQLQGGGFNIRGNTSTGKTTALFVGGSVWGGDAEHGFLQTWKATANGLEVVASAHNHILLLLDEIGECESREIGNVAYMLANGRGKLRMTKTIQSKKPLSWNLLFVSTGEQKITDKITEGGGTVKGGQEVRLCDLEADTGKFGLFENLHEFKSGQVFSDYLRSAACEFYGTPSRSFLAWLMESDFNALREDWHKFKDEFINEVLPETEKHPTEVYRAAARFALIAFGGELATLSGVTGWEVLEARTAVKTVFNVWFSGREGKGQSDVERGIRQLRKYLQNYEQSRFQKLWAMDEDKIIERSGFVRKNDDYEKEFLIFPDTFKEILKGYNPSSIAATLAEKEIIQKDSYGKTTKGVKIDGKNQRFYIINEKIFTFDEAEIEGAKSANG